jgi:DinB superfamily
MDAKEVIKSQYYASLEMLKEVINNCPPSLWNNQEPKNKFWHVAYHVLYCTHMYLQDSHKQFVPWSKHRDTYQFLGHIPLQPHARPNIGEPYTKEEILEYFDVCQRQVEQKVSFMDLNAESGFYWLPIKKLELQLYNIRHIQHHAGALIDRLRTSEGIGVDWVVKKPNSSE